ncbi:aconitase X catalytic domain-containing protein [Alkalibacter rhizosphaerae]|uniref:Aconitase X catalytic domain-containing protein n=1 Tax=Alkalibacter rhizosphaerae TaxID=2815577 RepID=A0A974XG47_9FIRM|nr:aconitase X catalytic domain-containing protein [Alkalibacter rhizosphaerae]QSX09239.1 aconitase X catalytic domain-containing protein [Alkalibacter rhizosphaerae]
MYLRDDEKAMLDGKEGLAVQKAMEMLVRYGEALGAEKLVDTNNVGGYMIADKVQMERFGSFNKVFSELSIDSDTAIEFPKVKVGSCQFETPMDPDYYHLAGKTKEDYDLYQKNMEFLANMGIQLMCTCTPYQVGNVPVKGEHCAWMESSAVVYINSVLGARTNCEGRESTTSAMLTGKIPYWGYHIPENRLGTHLVEVECDIKTAKDWGLLGYYVGKIVQDKVPVINNIKHNPAMDMIKHFGAAAASAGGIEMYHIPGITAEANSLQDAFGKNKPRELITFGKKEKEETYEILNSIGKKTEVDFVMLGCPHYSIDQIWNLCKMIEGKKVKDGVNFWVFAAQSIKDLAVRNGFEKIINDFGGLLMRDCCPALGRFKPEGSTVMATDSAKQGHYLPNMTGIEAWYGSTQECVDAAVTGRWGGKL